jgi:hypothetical protein
MQHNRRWAAFGAPCQLVQDHHRLARSERRYDVRRGRKPALATLARYELAGRSE